jgi:hypothetical protein
MSFSLHEIFGALAVIVGVLGQAVYIRSILRGETKPHLFTWLVWGTLGMIGFAAMVYDKAGPATWALGATAMLCLITSLLSLKYGEKTFTRGDKIALFTSMSAIIPWLLTDDPLGSVILISIIDIVAFYPTIRKSWSKPGEESLFAYNLGSLKFGLTVLAISNFTLTNALYPAAIVFINTAFVIMCLIRRKQLSPSLS